MRWGSIVHFAFGFNPTRIAKLPFFALEGFWRHLRRSVQNVPEIFANIFAWQLLVSTTLSIRGRVFKENINLWWQSVEILSRICQSNHYRKNQRWRANITILMSSRLVPVQKILCVESSMRFSSTSNLLFIDYRGTGKKRSSYRSILYTEKGLKIL